MRIDGRHHLQLQARHPRQLDGSWVNTADRWQESSPVLTTIYSLLALEETVR